MAQVLITFTKQRFEELNEGPDQPLWPLCVALDAMGAALVPTDQAQVFRLVDLSGNDYSYWKLTPEEEEFYRAMHDHLGLLIADFKDADRSTDNDEEMPFFSSSPVPFLVTDGTSFGVVVAEYAASARLDVHREEFVNVVNDVFSSLGLVASVKIFPPPFNALWHRRDDAKPRTYCFFPRNPDCSP